MHSTNGVPCKFFAEGRCRYGASCRFSHNQGGYGGGGGFGGYGSSGGGFQQASASDQAKQYAAIEESMQKDMFEWERGNIWPFSSYGPAGNRASIPGFEDLSMEELRFETLSAGQVPTHVAQMLSQSQKLRSMIVQDRSIARNLIDQAYKPNQSGYQTNQTQPQPQQSSLYSLLAKPAATPAPSIFGGASSLGGGGSLFGQAPGNVNPFQQPSQSSQSGSIFGSGSSNAPASSFLNTAQSQPASTFGQTTTPSIFGGGSVPSGSAPTFGGQSAFGSFATQPQQPTPSIFGGLGNSFGQSSTGASAPVFGSSIAPVAQAPPQQPSLFGDVTGTSSFGGVQSATPSAFGGGGLATQATQQQQQQCFGGDASQFVFKPQPSAVVSAPAQNQPTGFFNAPGASPRDKFVYSEMSELTPEDIAAYEAESFASCESIPLKAPPKELCR